MAAGDMNVGVTRETVNDDTLAHISLLPYKHVLPNGGCKPKPAEFVQSVLNGQLLPVNPLQNGVCL